MGDSAPPSTLEGQNFEWVDDNASVATFWQRKKRNFLKPVSFGMNGP